MKRKKKYKFLAHSRDGESGIAKALGPALASATELRVHGESMNEKNNAKKVEKLEWEKPSLEEVSQRVMAQPYIRFT